MRIGGVTLGFVLASASDAGPLWRFHVLQLSVTLSIVGLTGIESLLFGAEAAKLSGYGDLGGYQRQSGLNNLAVAVVCIWVWVVGWGFHAELSVFLVLLVFLTMSAINHVYSAWLAGNRRFNSYMRPVMLLALAIGVAPFIGAALSQASP